MISYYPPYYEKLEYKYAALLPSHDEHYRGAMQYRRSKKGKVRIKTFKTKQIPRLQQKCPAAQRGIFIC